MKKLLTGLVCLSTLGSTLAQEPNLVDQIPEAQRKEFITAMDRSTEVFKHDFNVTVVSQQFNAMFEKEFAGATALPAYIDHLDIAHRKGKGTFEAQLKGIPGEIGRELEKVVNEAIKKANVGEIWDQLTRSFMDTKWVTDYNAGQVSVENEKDDSFELFVSDLKEDFRDDLTLTSARFFVDRKGQVIKGIRFTISDEKDLIVKMLYKDENLPGKTEPTPVWRAVQVQQNSWLGPVAGFAGWPSKVTMRYKEYVFPSP